MFSIFYLEIMSMTKLISGKSKTDYKIAIVVNCAIFGFYFILFMAILLSEVISDKNTIEVLFI